jgi:hypothetical protein
MILAAIISFVSMLLLISHLSPKWLRRVSGYKGIFDVVLHGSILFMFFGTSTEGLLQAECAGIFFSLWLRGYRWLFGYERLVGGRWVRFTGWLTDKSK